MASLLSVNVGLPRDIAWQGKTVHTAVWKAPVQDRRMVRRLKSMVTDKAIWRGCSSRAGAAKVAM
jgi:hypothetical protein